MTEETTPVIYGNFQDAISGIDWKAQCPWEKPYYSCHRGCNSIKCWFKKQYQKWTTGFAHEESWNFHTFHAEWAVPRLKHLRDHNMGHPADINEDEWVEILNQIIWSFENHDKTIDPEYPDDYDHRQEVTQTEHGIQIRMLGDASKIDRSKNEAHHKKVDEGLALFAKYYQNLWD